MNHNQQPYDDERIFNFPWSQGNVPGGGSPFGGPSGPPWHVGAGLHSESHPVIREVNSKSAHRVHHRRHSHHSNQKCNKVQEVLVLMRLTLALLEDVYSNLRISGFDGMLSGSSQFSSAHVLSPDSDGGGTDGYTMVLT
ncbi:hypothetical protein [Lentibacillus cibarius]|uniref:hypothetical protein n=1 Tax=Lentibacillus cibarius TaxID=2583219 RepID=UPI00269773A7|nr:hypothetical protein [Lentibacillus cibarius]